MGTEQPQEPKTTDEGQLDRDRTGSPDQGTPEADEAMRQVEERAQAAPEESGPAPTVPPAPPADQQEG